MQTEVTCPTSEIFCHAIFVRWRASGWARLLFDSSNQKMSIYDVLSSKTPRLVLEDELIQFKEERVRLVECILLVILCAVNIATQGSRFSLNFVFYPHLQRDLGLTDTEYGILSGMGFSVIMVACMIPWGLAADNPLVGRKLVILAGLGIQGIFCSLQSVAWGFWSLLFIRFGLAAGQSAIQAPCLAILAKSYQRTGSLATANALFTMGIYLGGGLASIGGELAYIYGWKTTFIVFGMLCFIGALSVVLSVPDDRDEMRKEAEIRLNSPKPDLTGIGKFRYFAAWFTSPAPMLLTSAGCLRFMAGFCLTSFLPVYFQKHVAKDPSSIAHISLSYGIVTTVSGCISVVSGGFLSDSLLKCKVYNAPALVSAAGSLAAVPLTLLMFYAPVHESISLVFLFFSYLATWLWMGPSTSIAQVVFVRLLVWFASFVLTDSISLES
jgi:predicted MFS family arabinose efflux permease